MSSVTVDRRFGPFCPFVNKSKSCPNLSRRTDSLVQRAIQELLHTGQVAFEIIDTKPTFQGKIIILSQIKQFTKKKGVQIFQSEICVMNHDTIPAGTVFLLLTTQNPVPPNFN